MTTLPITTRLWVDVGVGMDLGDLVPSVEMAIALLSERSVAAVAATEEEQRPHLVVHHVQVDDPSEHDYVVAPVEHRVQRAVDVFEPALDQWRTGHGSVGPGLAIELVGDLRREATRRRAGPRPAP